MQVVQVCQDESSTVEQLEEVIASDPSIAARILRIANSAFFGYAQKVDSISRAIILLGFETVKSLALSTSVFDLFSGAAETRLDRQRFWLHSIACGRAAQMIAQDSDARPYHSTAFLAGLLHDIGKLVLDLWFYEEYSRVLLEVEKGEDCISEVEQRLLGFDHADAGAWFANSWGLPPTLTEPIGKHHSLDVDEESEAFIIAAVHVADVICRQQRIGSSAADAVPELNPLAMQILKLTDESLAAVGSQLSDEKEEIETFLNVL
jgi:HD-like signal output (HDOD) protein